MAVSGHVCLGNQAGPPPPAAAGRFCSRAGGWHDLWIPRPHGVHQRAAPGATRPTSEFPHATAAARSRDFPSPSQGKYAAKAFIGANYLVERVEFADAPMRCSATRRSLPPTRTTTSTAAWRFPRRAIRQSAGGLFPCPRTSRWAKCSQYAAVDLPVPEVVRGLPTEKVRQREKPPTASGILRRRPRTTAWVIENEGPRDPGREPALRRARPTAGAGRRRKRLVRASRSAT